MDKWDKWDIETETVTRLQLTCNPARFTIYGHFQNPLFQQEKGKTMAESQLYSFTSAAEAPQQFLREVMDLARAVKDDPINREHIQPLLGLTGCGAKTIAEFRGGGFFASQAHAEEKTLEASCDAVITTCEDQLNKPVAQAQQQTSEELNSGLWAILLPQLMNLLVAYLNRR